jgi:hypothetical protein
VERLGSTETRADLDVIAGDLCEEDPLLLLGALAHEALAQSE